ncbi:PKD domain-containing protein [Dysgonomonas sp. 520]|uniref:PKD domain-containing protein n=1 Tax=Dysgonomonas sp. 520 TaxID=2302931 RepID=UPI0013D09B41|nr:PKD domain-containing protein [Dysgonomonas sp. 520]NDW11059.1 PKD domain-containing protein [Dysgonomonas sp. 520]
MKKLLYILAILLFCSCHQEQTIPVEIDVALHMSDNYTSPLSVAIENKTRSASNFLWTFDGGEPATSTKREPGTVVFTTPGEHTITLEAWNDGDRTSKTYTVRVDNVVSAAFTATEEVNNYAPARFVIENQSTGATSYLWTFEGAEPATFEGEHPPVVTYKDPGTYTLRLVAGNGSAIFTAEQTIEVREALYADFAIVPSPEDEDDMEAPLRATFETELIGVESLRWECVGATISNPTSADAEILFPSAGDYSVKLTVTNNKQTKTVERNITISENTNLRTHANIRLGINTAQDIAVFYSTKLRRAISNAELDKYGSMVDIAFFGLNAQFSYNRFVSPVALADTPLKGIENAQKTKFINRTELGSIFLSVDDFNRMTTDALLKNIPIKEAIYGDEAFDNVVLPRVALFETEDKRKGAILIKDMVSDGRNSYITIDIKIQKND